MSLLEGKTALVFGVANNRSIAWGITQALHKHGATIGISYAGEVLERRAKPLAESIGCTFVEPCDITKDEEIEQIVAKAADKFGQIDILVHSIAFAPKADLQGGLLNCSAEGFSTAMDISCHSFIRMARLAAPLMQDGGTMFAMSYYGAQKVVPNYNVMGPVKAALEAVCRYLAFELGPNKIRVHAISPGPLKTRAASGLKDFDLMLNDAVERSPVGELVDIMDVGFACAYLATPYGRRLTGQTMYIDGGASIMA
jgi:enoyl-[acyl-carrier protein] reductase I